ncbi:hypothetical protein [Treponema pedis]|nr:hypothetical protein [Treponema pedis]
MGLDMKMKKKLSEETAKRYCTAGQETKDKNPHGNICTCKDSTA